MKSAPRFKIGEFVTLGERIPFSSCVVYPYYADCLDTAKPVQASRFWVFEVKRHHDSGKSLIVGGIINGAGEQVLGGWFDDDGLEPAMMKDKTK